MEHTKFKKVSHNNRKKTFKFQYTSGLEVEISYVSINITEKVIESGPDPEVGNHSFYYKLESGEIDYAPYDLPLHIINNPDYVREELLFKMTVKVRDLFNESKISKRSLARQMNTSVTQINRLLDHQNYKKDLSRLIEIAVLLNYNFEWDLVKVA